MIATKTPRLHANEAVVWYQRTQHLNSTDLASIDAVLSDEESARRDSFLFARDARDFAASRALLRNVLSRYGVMAPAEWRFERNDYGKPAVVAWQAGRPPLVFNTSHTHGLVACVVARGTSVGIDVERCSRSVSASDLAARLFAEPELHSLQRCGPEARQTRFIELWTLKEAYMKAVGLGLRLPLNSFAFRFEDRSRLLFVPPHCGDAWQFWLAALPEDTRLAIAVGRTQEQVPWRISFHCADPDNDSNLTLLRWSCSEGNERSR